MRIQYRLKDKTRVPGVTTIIGILDKPALKVWANRIGLQGIEMGKFVDNLASIGSLAHLMVEDYLRKEKKDYLKDYSKDQISKAENAFLKFLEWEKNNKLEVIEVEFSQISETYRFGGTIDLYCILNGKKTLIDIKTSKAIYSEHKLQTSAYAKLLEENNHKVEDVRILRIGREEAEGFDDINVGMIDLRWSKFLHCLSIYELNKKIKNG